MNILDFDYELPEERIAQLPVEPRDSSRLMVLHPKDHTIEHHHFHQLGEFLEKGDVLMSNPEKKFVSVPSYGSVRNWSVRSLIIPILAGVLYVLSMMVCLRKF